MRSIRIAIWLMIGVAASLATTAPATSQATDALPPEPAGFELDGDIDNGEFVFKQYCQKCHGKRGDGTGIMAADLDPKPADFTSQKKMAEVSDWELFIGIRDGGKPLGLSDQMTAWKGTLDEEEMHDVAVFIRNFSTQ